MRKPPTPPVSRSDNELAKLLATKIAEKRREKKLTQAQLAELLEVEPDTVSRMERGLLTPSLGRLLDYATVLDTTVNELLGDIPKGKSKTEQEWTALMNDLNASDKQLVLTLVRSLIARFKQ